MLTPAEKKILDKKLKQLERAQLVERAKFIEKRGLDKDGDKNWEKYKKKVLKWRDRYERYEYSRLRVTITRALYNKRKGKMSPVIKL